MLHTGVICLDFHREHPHLLAAGLKDGTVCIFDLRSEVQSSRGVMLHWGGHDCAAGSSAPAVCWAACLSLGKS